MSEVVVGGHFVGVKCGRSKEVVIHRQRGLCCHAGETDRKMILRLVGHRIMAGTVEKVDEQLFLSRHAEKCPIFKLLKAKQSSLTRSRLTGCG